MRGFQQAHAELETLGARVAGVSMDTFAALGAFAEQNSLTFPMLSDWPDGHTMDAFGVRRDGRPVATRATFVFDAQGVLREVIDDPRDMNAHPMGALAAVKRLAAERDG
ncbi:MAG: redoxin domain-containing protein [Dehalococcoidia bacterium]|nr:redoxin domain-containing protein [Dehalococcoidia bacterium]